jgi:hypothetical protein
VKKRLPIAAFLLRYYSRISTNNFWEDFEMMLRGFGGHFGIAFQSCLRACRLGIRVQNRASRSLSQRFFPIKIFVFTCIARFFQAPNLATLC